MSVVKPKRALRRRAAAVRCFTQRRGDRGHNNSNFVGAGMLTALVLRGLGVNWMEILYFLVIVGGIIALGYFLLIARRH